MARGRGSSEFRLRLVAEEVGKASQEFQQFGRVSQESMDRLARVLVPVNDNLRKVDSAASAFKDNLRATAANIAVLDGPLGGFASRVNALATAIGALGFGLGGLLLALSAGVFAFVKLTSATSDFERAQLRLQNVLKATGNEALITVRETNELALELARDTLTSIDEMRTAAASVLTSPNIRGVADVERILRLAQDFSEVFAGTTLRENARFLGAAFDSPISAFDNLRERGIKLSDQLRETLRTLEESGRRAQAAEILFTELERRVGGAGEIGGLPGILNQSAVETERNIDLFAEWLGVVDAVTFAIQGLVDVQRFVGDAIEANLRPPIQSLEEDLKRLEAQQERLRALPGGATSALQGEGLAEEVASLQRQITERNAITTSRERAGEFALQSREVEALIAQEGRLAEALDAVSTAFQPQRETQLKRVLAAGGGEAGLGPEGLPKVTEAFETAAQLAEDRKTAEQAAAAIRQQISQLDDEDRRKAEQFFEKRRQAQEKAVEDAKQLSERFADALRSLQPKTEDTRFGDLIERVRGSQEEAAIGEERIAALRRALGEQIHREELDREREKLSQRLENEARAAQEAVEQGARAFAARQEQERVNEQRQFERFRERLDPTARFERFDALLTERRGRIQEPAGSPERAQLEGELDQLRDLGLLELVQLPPALEKIESSATSAFNTLGDAALAAAADVENASDIMQSAFSSILASFAQTLLQVGLIDPIAEQASLALRRSFLSAVAGSAGSAAGSSFFAGGFAEGGSFTVPGRDTGRDSVLTSFMARPGEKVTVDPIGGGGSGLGGDATLRMILETPHGPENAATQLQNFGQELLIRASDHAYRRVLDAAGGRNRTFMRTLRIGRR